MSVDYGRAGNPGAYVMGILLPLDRPVEPELPQYDEAQPIGDQLPAYVVNILPGKPDRFSLNVIVSVHSFDVSHAKAWDAADAADHLILNTTAADIITLPDGSTLKGDINPSMSPHYIDYRDPRIKRYLARYEVACRFT